MSKSKLLLAAALATVAVAAGSLATTAPAVAKGFHLHRHVHVHGRFVRPIVAVRPVVVGVTPACYYIRKPFRIVKVCPIY